jgi:hypothetical protein
MPKSVIVEPIAKVELVWIRKDASEVLVIAQLGLPYQVNELSWACPSELKGIDSQYPDIQGGSSMQAICLAIRLIKTRLGHLLDDGEIIYEIADRSEKLDRAYLETIFAS